MITKFFTEVTVRFNPFSVKARSARLFLAHLPPKAWQSVAVKTTVLPRATTEPTYLSVKFKDGKAITVDCENLTIKSVMEEVDRHSRKLQKEEDLAA